MVMGRTLLGAFALIVLAHPVLALPPAIPFSPYGTAKVNGANVAEGTLVSAWCDGVSYRQTVTLFTGGESWYVNLDIPGDDPETPDVKEGCSTDETISFRIGDLLASQTAKWRSGVSARLDLTATGSLPPTATSTPTRTPTATRSPTPTPTRTATRSSTPARTRSPAPTPTPTPTQTNTRVPLYLPIVIR
jgi:hypothetical protein